MVRGASIRHGPGPDHLRQGDGPLAGRPQVRVSQAFFQEPDTAPWVGSVQQAGALALGASDARTGAWAIRNLSLPRPSPRIISILRCFMGGQFFVGRTECPAGVPQYSLPSDPERPEGDVPFPLGKTFEKVVTFSASVPLNMRTNNRFSKPEYRETSGQGGRLGRIISGSRKRF